MHDNMFISVQPCIHLNYIKVSTACHRLTHALFCYFGSRIKLKICKYARALSFAKILYKKDFWYLFKACSPLQKPPAHLLAAASAAYCSLHTFLQRTHGSCRCQGPSSLLLLLQKVDHFPISSKNIQGEGVRGTVVAESSTHRDLGHVHRHFPPLEALLSQTGSVGYRHLYTPAI